MRARAAVMGGVRRVLRAAAATALLLPAACLDFADPVVPNRAASASLQANMRIFGQGVFQVDGTLMPGRDSAGFQRTVQSPFIYAAGHLIEPRTLGERGLRTYSTAVQIPPGETLGPFELVAPSVRDVAPLPDVRLWGLRRLDPDTIVVVHGQDVVLHMDTAAAVSDPPNVFRQWFLDVSAGSASFRISGNGPPPLRLRIPSDWVPQPQNNHAFVSLIYYQSAQLRSADQLYMGSVLLDVRLNWVIRFVTDP
jgi:hypothetical protein